MPNAAAAVDELATMVATALQAADALQLWDVSIGLDRARLAVEKLRSELVPPAPGDPRPT